MDVRLLTIEAYINIMEHNAAYAMLTCRDNTEKLDTESPDFFIKKAIKAGHDSILEHINLTYEVTNLSRACLQELARHRHISLSVESTRHTLKDKAKEIFKNNEVNMLENSYLVPFKILCEKEDITNDKLKYFLPEFWPTNLVMTANVRELRHIVKLRTNPAALPEFQELAKNLVEELPERYKYFLADCVYSNEKLEVRNEK